jgi:hypothetical protein
MVDDAAAAQARLLLDALYEHVSAISDMLEKAERRAAPVLARAAAHRRRQQTDLRRELYEVHRLIDGLHRQFPETLDNSQRTSAPVHTPRLIGTGQARQFDR